MTTELSDVVKELSDAFENRVYPDADAVMKSLKDLDDYLKPYEKCDIHEIWYGDGELVNALFHLVATNAKTLLYASLVWMDIHDRISDLDAKFKELFKGTEYEKAYKPYSIHFGMEIAFPDVFGKAPVCKEERRDYIKANMQVLEFNELCNYMLNAKEHRDILQGFVDFVNNSKASGDCSIGPEHISSQLGDWKLWNEEQIISREGKAPVVKGWGGEEINTKMQVLEFNELCNYMLNAKEHRRILQDFVDFLTKSQAFGDCLIGPECVRSQLGVWNKRNTSVRK